MNDPKKPGEQRSPEDEALCREVREMLGDTPEEAECGCREDTKN